MERYRVKFDEQDAQDRRVLHDALERRVPVIFRGERVTVVAEYKLGPNGESAPYLYVLQVEDVAPRWRPLLTASTSV